MKPKVRKVYIKLLALAAIPFILSGCSEQSQCNVKETHVHLYTNQAKGATIKRYLYSEDLKTYSGYNWNKDYIEVTDEDLEFYKAKGNLFYGPDNWEYLYNVMKSQKDYLEFYYHYTEDTVMTSVDAEGNMSSYVVTDTHSGWSNNPKHRGVTGKVRVVHSRFHGYRFVTRDGKHFEKQQGKSVDDIRDTIDKYPYFDNDCVTLVNREYKVDKSILTTLKVEDLDEFTGPDLENKNLYTNSK